MIGWTLPWAAALILPALWLWWQAGRQGHGRWWRLAALLLAIAAMTGPVAQWGRGGSDVIFIADRSASMSDNERHLQDELITLIADQRGSGDRLGVITVGEQPVIAQAPQAHAIPRLADAAVNPTATALADAIDRAVMLIPPHRSARIFMHTDGEATGIDPGPAATRAAATGIPIDAMAVIRPPAPDAAIMQVETPGSLRLGESFIAAVQILSDRTEQRRWRVWRDDRQIAEGTIALQAGSPRVCTFADRPPRPGVARYTVELEGATGFSKATTIDADQLIAQLRSNTAITILQPALAEAGISVDQLFTRLSTILLSPAGQSALQQLTDPVLRETALTTVHQLLVQEMPKLAADQVMSTLHNAISAAEITDGDRQPLNNRANAAVRIEGGEHILVISDQGVVGNVAGALQTAGLTTTVRAPGPISLTDLAAYSAVVIDDIPADTLTASGLAALARWTEHLGGGLVMLGGRRSFGAGGYRRSPVEDVLPVTLELRDEHRKLACSIAVAIDISGSMSAPVADGRMKLELAAEGAAAVIEMLGPRDEIAVYGVDSTAHTVLDPQPVQNPKDLAHQVIGMQPGGGGIFVYEALAAAGTALLDSKTGTRHIVLFADASDSEEPGDYKQLLADYVAAGITVSVIGLGSDRDSDAQLLIDVAARGNGRCTFAEAAEDIPRLFAQETVLIARSTWVNDPCPLTRLDTVDMLLGAQTALDGPWPNIAGYNVTYARPRSMVVAQAQGDPVAPGVATWRIGTGRSVAIPFDYDHPDNKALLQWPGYAPLLSSLVRWAAGEGTSVPGALTSTLHGRDAVFRLTMDPDARDQWPSSAPRLAVAIDGSLSDTTRLFMVPVDDGVWEARHQLSDDHTVIPAVDIGGQAILGPALCLPYIPEAEPRHHQPSGVAVLEDLTRISGGIMRSDVVHLFNNPPSPGTHIDLAPWLVIAALLCILGEIAVRRMQLSWPSRTNRRSSVPGGSLAPATNAPVFAANTPSASPPVAPDTPAELPANTSEGLHDALRQLRKRRK